MSEYVIIVDENDGEIGIEEKIKAHKEGKLHRAFSIFIFNAKDEMLLQKRARGKYHSGGLWTNACCSHPRPGEQVGLAAHRRLVEEMGFDCELKEIFPFRYEAVLDNGLIENEVDHVFIGGFDGRPTPDPKEVDAWRYMPIEELKKDVNETPEKYTYWCRRSFEKVLQFLGKP